MSYRITGLPPALFAPLWPLDDKALAERHIRRVVADRDHGYPCRVSLQDAEAGETLLLLPFEHHGVAGPYRAAGPIYVRQRADRAVALSNQVPPYLSRRLLSVRGYDETGWMRSAEVVEGASLEPLIVQLLERTDIAYLHVHNARPGCYACRVDRD
ncbi:DUF1203 domain-containing protein [Pseudoxanthomonas wuyuanensis]